MYNNHFEIFELPVSFDINKDTLAQRYRDLQRAVHPDKYANAPDRERRLAMQKTVQINEAFQTLKNPLTRAGYLLQLQGIDQNDGIMDGEFLMTQMDLREEL
ncbi:co-chaperone HscB, partial [Candidatus Thiomargarita nelsonii]